MRHDRRVSRQSLIFWLPTFAGVAVLAAALIFTTMRLIAPAEPTDALPQPILPFAPITSVPFEPEASGSAAPSAAPGPGGGDPVVTSTPATTGTGDRTQPPPRRATPTRTPEPPRRAELTGTYRVLDSYGDGYIAEVLVATSSSTDRDWKVTLRVPSSVTKLNTSWVEGAPQATLSTSGRTYTWRSGVPVPARSSVPLRFHFARGDGGDFPVSCEVNGAACAIRR